MIIREIVDESLWNDAVTQFDKNTFLHSIQWGNLNSKQKHSVRRYGLFTPKDEIISIAQIIKIRAKRGTILFCPHGPQAKTLTQDILQEWTDFLTHLGQTEGADVVRISPIEEVSQDILHVFKACKYRKAPIHMHAELTTVVDLTPDEKGILGNMRKTMRQMIKKGTKLVEAGDVTITYPDTISEDMLEVYRETVERGGFAGFPESFLHNEWNAFKESDNATLICIKHKGVCVSWGLVIFYGKHAFYHQGANRLSKEVPAAYLTHWTGMQQAKLRGCETYDFWGIAPKDNPKHPWAKISTFKRGFGGKEVALARAQDYVLTNKYWFMWFVETIRAHKRGFRG